VNTTSTIMREFALALVPGVAALTWYFGPGILVNVVIAAAAAVATEILVLQARGSALTRAQDGSALVTGILLGLCLPPLLPVWMVVFACAFAMLFGKHLYGGLGHNPFNPAMVGYAMLIVAFPLAMSAWPSPGFHQIGVMDTLTYKLGAPIADGFSMATPLDAFRFRGAATVEEFHAATSQATFESWRWINVAFLAGGLYLVYRRISDWILPISMLATLVILASLFYDSGSSHSLGSPLLHLTSGATMVAAFFIITDPVTSPDGRHGKIAFGVGIGALTFLIRSIGAYPDGIAFAVLLMNASVPLLEQARWRFG
jgi:electron transport complex protein RnfD